MLEHWKLWKFLKRSEIILFATFILPGILYLPLILFLTNVDERLYCVVDAVPESFPGCGLLILLMFVLWVATIAGSVTLIGLLIIRSTKYVKKGNYD